MKLTTQLVSFITLCVIASMAMVLLGGVFSFRELGMELQQKKVNSLVEVIDKQLEVADDHQDLTRWLPTLLRSVSCTDLRSPERCNTTFCCCRWWHSCAG